MRWSAKDERLYNWTSWYAWRPVRVDDQWVWLETIERYLTPAGISSTHAEYRIPNSEQ